MRITPLCRALALHEIFDQAGVAAGGSLLLSDVALAWSRSGLRRGDLTTALAEAEHTGEFVTRAFADGDVVVMTALGHDRAQRDLSSLIDIEELVQAYVALGELRRRSPDGPAYGRRAEDRVSA